MHNADYELHVEVYLKRASNSHASEVDLIKQSTKSLQSFKKAEAKTK